MNKYESHLLRKDTEKASLFDFDFIEKSHLNIVSRRDKKKQYDKLLTPGYKKDFFGNIFRNGR
jgi:hypothetical protein